jgi:type IV pilus assembly protein PilM
MDVLLVAAKKDEINDTAQIAREAKLKPMVIDVDAFTVQNTFEANYGLPGGHRGADQHRRDAHHHQHPLAGDPAFTRNIINGGNAITEEIQKRLGISFEEAETYKTGAAAGRVDGPLGGARARCRRSSSRWSRGSRARSSGRWTSTWRRAASGDLADLHRRRHGQHPRGGRGDRARAKAPVELLDPFKDIAVDLKEVNGDLLNLHRAQVAVAIGLSLRKDREKA